MDFLRHKTASLILVDNVFIFQYLTFYLCYNSFTSVYSVFKDRFCTEQGI